MSETQDKAELKQQLESRIGFTTAVIAVFLAFNSILGNNCDNDTILLNSKASNQWSYYQSKSIKENVFETTLYELELETYNVKDNELYKQKLAEQIQFFKTEIARYKTEREAIKVQAETFAAGSDRANELGDYYDLAEGFYQVAIVLAALTFIATNKNIGSISILSGAIAILITAYGYFIA